jgi:AI-2 transport protein TqsA
MQLDRLRTICLLVLSAIAVGGALYWLAPVMIPFVLALFVSVALVRMMSALQRWLHLPRTVAMAIILLGGLAVIAGVGGLVALSVSQITENSTAYQTQFEHLLARLNPLLARFKLDVGSLLPSPSTLAAWMLGATNALATVVSEGLVVMIFVVFLLGGSHQRPTDGVFADIEARIQGYLLTKAAISGLVGVVTGVVLSILGVDLALVFGVFAFLLNFIPNIGPVIATLLPLPIVLMDAHLSTTSAVLAIVLPGTMHFFIGNVIEPKIMGESLDLDPVVVLVTLIFWGMIWGFVGLLLATPITAVLKILLERHELTLPVANALAGRVGEPHRPPDPAGSHAAKRRRDASAALHEEKRDGHED